MNETPPPDGTDADTRTAPPPYDGEGPRVTNTDLRDLARLRRSSTDRKIAGVAGGIARHLDIDPLVVRVALAVLVFFGGGGILLYGAAWLLVPDDSGKSIVSLDDRSRTVALGIVGVLVALSLVGDAFGGWDFPWPLAIVGVVVVVLATRKHHPGSWHDRHGWHGMSGWHGPRQMRGWQGAPAGEGAAAGGAATYPGYEPPPPGTPRAPHKQGPILFGFALALAAFVVGVVATIDAAGADVASSAYPAVVMATFGAMLVIGAFYGRAGGLILAGLVAAAMTLTSAVADDIDDIDGFATGEATHSPGTIAELDDRYDLFAGEIVLDLTEFEDLDELDSREVDLDITFGQITVIVPDDGLDVNADASIDGAGEVDIFGDQNSASSRGHLDGGEDVPSLSINADVVFGEIEFVEADYVGSAA